MRRAWFSAFGGWLIRGLGAALVLLATWQGAEAASSRLIMATGTQGGSAYIWGATAGKALAASGLNIAVQSGNTAASSALIEKGDIDLGMSSTVDVFKVYGDEVDETRLRVVYPVFPTGWVTVVPANSPVKTIYDLKGKRVAIGPRGHVNLLTNQQVLDALGLKESDFVPEYISAGNGVSRMREGVVDAVMYVPGFPSPQLAQAATMRGGFRLITLSEEDLQKVIRKYGKSAGYLATTFPAGIQPEIQAPLKTISSWLWLLGRDDLPEEIAYRITKSLSEQHDTLTQEFGAFRGATAEFLAANSPYKLHRGTERYLREAGLLK